MYYTMCVVNNEACTNKCDIFPHELQIPAVLFEQVVHEDSQPSEIVFTVQSPPALGFLQRFPPMDKHQNNNGEQQHLYQVQPTLQPTFNPAFGKLPIQL